MSNPVRIYLLHHPDSKLAARLVDRIYEWFRLPSLEGIPVYLRSMPAKGRKHPLPPDGKLTDERVQYFIPLIDAHMVRDPAWHDYLTEIATQCADSARRSPKGWGWGWRMFPVAVDSTAFNLPEAVSRLNFIRFGLKAVPKPVDPKTPTEEERKAKKAWEEAESEDMLKHLTEAFARDLNGRLFPEQAKERFQIFISYARADSTEEAKALRNYIQGQTQCLVFFDENDIGFGQAFGESLEHNAGANSKALIVINSDHYADRPWCRWEIDRFLRAAPSESQPWNADPGVSPNAGGGKDGWSKGEPRAA
jgi:TIR domain